MPDLPIGNVFHLHKQSFYDKTIYELLIDSITIP